MLLLIIILHIIYGKLYYLSDIKHNVPYCSIESLDEKGNISKYNLTNIMGSVDITNDPLVRSLNFNFYLSLFIDDTFLDHNNMINSCELCHISSFYCNNDNKIKKGNLLFSENILINFRVIIKKIGNYGFSHDKEKIITKYKVSSNSFKSSDDVIYSNVKVDIDDLLLHNKDNYDSLDCNTKLDILFHVVISTNNMSITRDFILMPIDIYKSIDNKLSQSSDNYQLLCIPSKEYLSSYDCSQSNIYRVIKYEFENCLIPEKTIIDNNKTKENDNEILKLQKDLLNIDIGKNCSVYDHMYYNTLLYNNEKTKFKIFNLNNSWCNETWLSVLDKSYFEKDYIKECFNRLGISSDYEDSIYYDNNIYLKPFYRFYKETLITYFNYINCNVLTKRKNYKIERLLYKSIGIITNSCMFKEGFNMDIKEYSNIFKEMMTFNLYGDGVCIKCYPCCMDEKIHYHCKDILQSIENNEEYINRWINITKKILSDYNESDDEEKNKFGILFDMILEKDQNGIESNILFALFFIITFISVIVIIYMINGFCKSYVKK
jgi:hypothetical protein